MYSYVRVGVKVRVAQKAGRRFWGVEDGAEAYVRRWHAAEESDEDRRATGDGCNCHTNRGH